jgi:hypothetical protein
MPVRKVESGWRVYRTRFLIRAKQLTEPLIFRDALEREHRGQIGDYLAESSDGTRRIAPREIFEDVYVAMGPADIGPTDLVPAGDKSGSPTGRELRGSALPKRRVSSRAEATA